MMKLFKPGGAISVFLVIILVPCLVVSFLFVDLSRVELSKAAVVSSADTALNSLMANYDIDLNEYYGLVASCQDIDQFYDDTEEYFRSSLAAAGLGDAVSDDIVTFVMNQSRGASDFLQVKALEDNFNVYAVNDSGLGGNATLIKEGVVEFMKYRAPMEIATSFLSILFEEGTEEVTNAMNDSEDNSRLTETRETFAETENELNQAEFYTFYFYNEYKNISPKPDKSELDDMKTSADDYREAYLQITEKAAESLWITDAPDVTTFRIGFDSYVDDDGIKHYRDLQATESRCYDVTEVATSYSSCGEHGDDDEANEGKYCIKYSTLKAQIDTVNTLKGEFETLIGATDFTTYNDMEYGTENDQYSKAQWYYFAGKMYNSKIGDIKSKANELIKATNKLYAMTTLEVDCVHHDRDDVPATTATSDVSGADDLCASIVTLVDNNMKHHNADNAFCKVYSSLTTMYSDNIKNQYSASSVTIAKTGKTVETSLSDISSSLSGFKTQLQTYITAIDKVINGSDGKGGLATIRTAIGNYGIDYNAWNQEADSGSDNIHQVNQEEADGYSVDKLPTVTEVNNFEAKLNAVKSVYQTAMDEISAIKFNNAAIIDIDSYSDYKSQFSPLFTTPTSPQKNSTIKDTAGDIFDSAFKPSPEETVALITVPSDFKAILEKGDDDYYDMLLAKEYDTNKTLAEVESAVEDGNSQIGGFEKQGEVDVEAESTKGLADIPNINKTDADGEAFGLGDTVTAFASLIEQLVTMNGPAIRDAIYVSLYAKNMFSYRTFDYEGKYSLLSDSKQSSIDQFNYNTAEYYPSVATEWADDDKEFTDNKSLTNYLINADNNKAFGAELEYILYGKSSLKNLGSAYGDIYVIRLAFNTVSGFVNFYPAPKGDATPLHWAIEGLAQGISSATSFIIPAALIKCVLILMVAALESLNDMSRLTSGLPVELYKKDEKDWFLSLSPSGEPVEPTEGKALGEGLCLQYSDYLFLFLYSGFVNNNTDMYIRLGNVIEANMQHHDGDGSSYDLSKAKTLFVLSGTMEVTPLMMDLPLSSEYEDGLLESLNWKQFDVEIIRGY